MTDLASPSAGSEQHQPRSAPLPSPASERWRSVLGAEGRYEVSDHGRVRSLCHGGDGRPRRTTPLILKPKANVKGYLCVHVSRRFRRIHSLVLEAFVSPRPAGRVAAHLDGIAANNNAGNLAWVTPAENEAHKRVHGTMYARARHHAAKLNEEDVASIREMRRLGAGPRALARVFSVTRGTIMSVVRGATWR